MSTDETTKDDIEEDLKSRIELLLKKLMEEDKKPSEEGRCSAVRCPYRMDQARRDYSQAVEDLERYLKECEKFELEVKLKLMG